MSNEKTTEQKKPNLNQVFASNKLMAELTTLHGLVAALNSRICSNNFVINPATALPPNAGFVGFKPQYRGFFPTQQNFFNGMGQEQAAAEMPDMGLDAMTRGPFAVMQQFASDPRITQMFPQIFFLKTEEITVEKLEDLTKAISDIQKNILQVISDAGYTQPEV